MATKSGEDIKAGKVTAWRIDIWGRKIILGRNIPPVMSHGPLMHDLLWALSSRSQPRVFLWKCGSLWEGVETSEFDVDGLETKGLRGMTTDIAGMAALLWTSVVLCFSDTPELNKVALTIGRGRQKSIYKMC